MQWIQITPVGFRYVFICMYIVCKIFCLDGFYRVIILPFSRNKSCSFHTILSRHRTIRGHWPVYTYSMFWVGNMTSHFHSSHPLQCHSRFGISFSWDVKSLTILRGFLGLRSKWPSAAVFVALMRNWFYVQIGGSGVAQETRTVSGDLGCWVDSLIVQTSSNAGKANNSKSQN